MGRSLLVVLAILAFVVHGCGLYGVRNGERMSRTDTAKYDTLGYHVMSVLESSLEAELRNLSDLPKDQQQYQRQRIRDDLNVTRRSKMEYRTRMNKADDARPHVTASIPAYPPEQIREWFNYVPHCCAAGEHGPWQ